MDQAKIVTCKAPINIAVIKYCEYAGNGNKECIHIAKNDYWAEIDVRVLLARCSVASRRLAASRRYDSSPALSAKT